MMIIGKKIGLSCAIMMIMSVLSAQSSVCNIMDIPMVYVQGSNFNIGYNANDTVANVQLHWVKVKDFYISPYEVTQALWTAVMGKNPSRYKGDSRPVERVSWYDCQLFIDSLNRLTGMHYRLPTEAEWEFAAREGHFYGQTDYSGSRFVNTVARYKDNSNGATWKVGSRMPNALNIYDMSGNVWEWCSDTYAPYGTEENAASDKNKKTYKVCRGGAYNSVAEDCNVRYRGRQPAKYKHKTLGFRLVLSDE
ncbi:MAG: formylglycine-generating enzyme family protein [Bacteroidales bacterium]|nr:formylglycine-generating enzyme family protein [Bacteroidales bacterium]